MARTVLYVDDDADDREMFGCAFEECDQDFELTTAKSALDALEQLKSEEIPLCIYIDINMPKMNGLEFLRILKANEQYTNIPAFILSTSIDPVSAREARALGAAEVLIKPVSLQGLRDQLQFCFNTHVPMASKYLCA